MVKLICNTVIYRNGIKPIKMIHLYEQLNETMDSIYGTMHEITWGDICLFNIESRSGTKSLISPRAVAFGVYSEQVGRLVYLTMSVRDDISKLDLSAYRYDKPLTDLYTLLTSDRYIALRKDKIADAIKFKDILSSSSIYIWTELVYASKDFIKCYEKRTDRIARRRAHATIHLLKKTNRICDDNIGDVMGFVGVGSTSTRRLVEMVYA